MSWNKNTQSNSQLDKQIQNLQGAKVPYNLSVRGKVVGLGLNDGYAEDSSNYNNGNYLLRVLETKLNENDLVYVEVMYRTHDCDLDDSVIDWVFDKLTWEKIKEKFPLEVCIEESYHPGHSCKYMNYDDYLDMVKEG